MEASQELVSRPTRGGRRKGAGRKPKPENVRRPLVKHLPRPALSRMCPVHATIRRGKRLPSMRDELIYNEVRRSLDRKQIQSLKRAARGDCSFQIVHFSVQHDHIHLIVEAANRVALARGMAGLAIRVARAVNKRLGRRGRFWHDRYHRSDLPTARSVRNAIRYVLHNFTKHAPIWAGHGVIVDPLSSASTFDGYREAVPLIVRVGLSRPDPPPWPRMRPWTWLLRAGWRLAGGLLSAADHHRAR